MRDIGAVGPGMARQAGDLPEIVRESLGRFVDAGFIREGPAGTFYLDEARASVAIRIQWLKTIVFWFLVIIIPVIILQLSPR